MISHPPTTTTPDPRDERIAELEARVAELQQKLAELQAQLAELERAGKRQAAPLARKRPGRKAGQGKFGWRVQPTPEQVMVTQEVPLPACPVCGGGLQARKRHEQFVINVPEAPPTVTRYVAHSAHSGHCAACQQRVRSRHPEQISDATGTASARIRPRSTSTCAGQPKNWHKTAPAEPPTTRLIFRCVSAWRRAH